VIPLDGPLIHPARSKQLGQRRPVGVASQATKKGTGGSQSGQGAGDVGRGSARTVVTAGGIGPGVSPRRSNPIDQRLTQAEHSSHGSGWRA
jgi:hypothetical protein